MDGHFIDSGSVVLLVPESQGLRDWLEEYIGQDNGYQPYWPTVVIEARYAEDILGALADEGFDLTV